MMKLTFKNPATNAVYEIDLADSTVFTADDVNLIADKISAEHKEIHIPEGITELSDDCLSSLDHISAIHFPSTLEKVTAHSFGFLPIEEVVVHPNNKLLCSLNGVLYNKDFSDLIYYPKNKNAEGFTTPDSVITIKTGAFAGVKNLRYFTATQNVTTLEKGCFTNASVENVDLSACHRLYTIPSLCFTLCRNLKTVLLPHNLKAIKKLAFDVSAITDELKLPDSIEKLGRNALSRNSLQKIKLPKNLEVLGDRVFAGCKELISIDLSMAVKIHKKSFSECSNLCELLCDKENEIFSTADGILYDKRSSTLLKCPDANEFDNGKLVIPDGTKVIDLAFDSCNKLTEVYIPDSVETIKRGAFYKCNALKKIHIGKNCSSFDLFDHCHNIEYIEISEDNPYFVSVDDVVYSKDKQKLIFYPRAKTDTSFTIPYGVKEIEPEAFKTCHNLKEVSIPSSVLAIGASAFEACKNLTYVNMTDSADDTITKMGECAFAFCESLISLHIPDNTVVGNYCFIGDMNLSDLSKGKSVFYGKNAFAITTFKDVAQSDDFGLLKQIIDKAPTKLEPINKFKDTKKHWGE